MVQLSNSTSPSLSIVCISSLPSQKLSPSIHLYKGPHQRPQHPQPWVEKKGKKMSTKTKPIDEKRDKVVIRAVSHDEEGRKRVEKTELHTHNIDSIKHFEKKLIDKGVQRLDRHPAVGRRGSRQPPKSGHGGKYTWEGPDEVAEYELEPDPPAIDEGDPNYEEEEAGGVVGEVEVAKKGRVGLSRVEFIPQMNA